MFVDICWLYTPSNPQSQSLWIYLGLGSAIPLSDYVTVVYHSEGKGILSRTIQLITHKATPNCAKIQIGSALVP